MNPVSTLSIPRTSHDHSIWTNDLTAAQTAFGHAATLQVIRHLRFHGPKTRAEIVDATLIGHGRVGQSLNKLKSLGIVSDDASPAYLPARDRKYTLDRERTDHLLHVMASFITVDDL